MKVQACMFRRKTGEQYQAGIAILTHGFDMSSVDTVIDSDGERVPDGPGFDYRFSQGPLAYIDTAYSDSD